MKKNVWLLARRVPSHCIIEAFPPVKFHWTSLAGSRKRGILKADVININQAGLNKCFLSATTLAMEPNQGKPLREHNSAWVL